MAAPYIAIQSVDQRRQRTSKFGGPSPFLPPSPAPLSP